MIHRPVRLRPLSQESRLLDAPLPFRYAGGVRYAPLMLGGGFFVVTVLLFAFGPFDWHISNATTLYLFLTGCGVALGAGYWLAVPSALRARAMLRLGLPRAVGAVGHVDRHHEVALLVRPSPNVGPAHFALLRPSTLVAVSSAIALLIYLPTVRTTTGRWIPDVVLGLTDAGAAYQTSKYFNTHGSQAILYARMLLGPFLICIYPVTLFLYSRLSVAARVLGALAIVSAVALGIAQGTNKTVADLAVYALLFLALLFVSLPRETGRWQRRLTVLAVAVIGVVGLFFAYFTNSIRSRVETDTLVAEGGSLEQDEVAEGGSVEQDEDAPTISAQDIDAAIADNATFSHADVRERNVIYRITPAAIRSGEMYLISYVTHGYKGLSLAMDHEFTPSFGLGFSPFLRHNALRVTGDLADEASVVAGTYGGKIVADGWETGLMWSTFFIYPASDVTFVGTVVLVFMIGCAWSRSWRDALEGQDTLAIVVFFHLTILVFYLPANNQIFQNGETAIGFLVVFVAWLARRMRTRQPLSADSGA